MHKTIGRLEGSLRREIRRNAQYRQQDYQTELYIRKLAQNIQEARDSNRPGAPLGPLIEEDDKEEQKVSLSRPGEDRNEGPALEFLAREINGLVQDRLCAVKERIRAGLRRSRTRSADPTKDLKYGFSFNPTKDPDDDVFGLGLGNASALVNNPHERHNRHKRPQGSLRRPLERARWTPDDATDACEACRSPFTWYRWRHHCRSCGRLVCHDCSSNCGYVPGYADRKVRICLDCHTLNEQLKKVVQPLTSIYSGNFNTRRPRTNTLTS